MTGGTATACEEFLRLRPGVYSAVGPDGELVLQRRHHTSHWQSFGRSGTGRREMLRLLAGEACDPSRLTALGEEHGADDPRAFLEELRAGGWLTTTVHHRAAPLYTVEPVRRPAAVAGPAAGDVVLSRFTVLRRDGDQLVAESPVATARLRILDARVAALLCALVPPLPDSAVSGLPDEAVARLLHDLGLHGLATPSERSQDPESTELRLRQWRPHELWFHQRTRIGGDGYTGDGFGRTQWAKGEFEPLPVRHDPFPGPVMELYRPDLATLHRTDMPLTAALETRRSARIYDDSDPMTARQLGELLCRCARARRLTAPDGTEVDGRPYPAGGGSYELELYPVVRRVAGLEPGLYHYDPHGHRLELVRRPGTAVARLLRSARDSAGMPTAPQLLIVVAARFGRLMWTYEEIPYSLILKHVGVLYQTIYLTATAMGLGACALGAGDSLAFAEATGLDYTDEGSVGEIALGSPSA